MATRQEKIGFRINCTLILTILLLLSSLFSLAWADGRNDSDFFKNYKLTQREKCEIFSSFSGKKDTQNYSSNCNKTSIFMPIRSLGSNEVTEKRDIHLSSKKDEDWQLVDVSVKMELVNELLVIKGVWVNNRSYNLSEYLFADQTNYDSIEIGNIDNVIIIQLKNQSIIQVSIIPHYCYGDGDELTYVDYSVSQVFSWYPPMQEDSYTKTFFKSPTCI